MIDISDECTYSVMIVRVVLMICTEENSQLLENLLSQYEIETSSGQRKLLLRHLDLVVEKNRHVNLTRIINEQDAVVRHVIDSLLFIPTVYNSIDKTKSRFLDIGTGAGFPGIPIAIMTDYSGLLIDSVGKKTDAVAHFITELSLEDRLDAKTIRAEELAKQERESFDCIVARAVAEISVLIEYASPLLKKNGCLVISKGRPSDEEVSIGDATARIVGMRLVSRETYELPYEMGHREVFCYRKTSKSKVKLPRKVGMAKHKPLVTLTK